MSEDVRTNGKQYIRGVGRVEEEGQQQGESSLSIQFAQRRQEHLSYLLGISRQLGEHEFFWVVPAQPFLQPEQLSSVGISTTFLLR